MIKFECPACGSTKYCKVNKGKYTAICYGMGSGDCKIEEESEQHLIDLFTERIRFYSHDVRLQCHQPIRMIEEEVSSVNIRQVGGFTTK